MIQSVNNKKIKEYAKLIQKKEKISKLKERFPDDKPPDFVDFAKTPFKSNKRKPK